MRLAELLLGSCTAGRRPPVSGALLEAPHFSFVRLCHLMPNIASLHPQVVHFVVVLAIIGVLLRLIALTGKWAWMHAAATSLIVAGAVASMVAVRSGTDAHGPVERVPGSRAVVQEHEELGKMSRNVLIGVAAIELIALVLAGRAQRALRFGAAALGLYGVYVVYEAAAEGGELVYSYAGGVGIRTGEPADVSRLLLAGLYHQAMLDRKNGKGGEAAGAIAELRRRWPADSAVILLSAESLLHDKHDPAAALAALDSIRVPAENRRLLGSVNSLRADALAAAGMKDSARVVLQNMLKDSPGNPRLKARLDSLR